MNIEWRRENGRDIWHARVLPNPMGLELEACASEIERGGHREAVRPFEWFGYATTPEGAEEIATGQADTLDDAKVAAEAWTREHLFALSNTISDVLYPTPGAAPEEVSRG